jgi:lysophospholipase L1-like esterase
MSFRWAFAALLSAAAAAAQPTIYIAGDSTAANAKDRGWGEHLAAYFDPAKAALVNRARGGRSARTFYDEGLWSALRDSLRPGDYVLIQFGHNDGGSPNQDKARGDLPGTGDEVRDFTMPDGSHRTVHTFGWYLRTFVRDARAKGAHPLLLSLTVRNIWKDGAVERGDGYFNDWTAAVANAEKVPYLDVTDAIADRYEALGAERVAALFPEDHTHTSPEGAGLNASLVVACLKGLSAAPFDSYLSAKGKAVMPYLAPRDPALPTLWLIGDSTVRNGHGDGSNGQWGWGEPLADLFDTTRINVVNRALGGTSSRTFLTQGLWNGVLRQLKPGDFVLMQFGHNDNGPLDDQERARGTLPGTGDETREIDNPITKQHETVHTYGWYLRRFIADARAKGAIPIACSLIPRKAWKDGRILRNSTTYQKWAAEVAASENTGYIDLNEKIAARYDALGPDKVDPLFGDPHTHTSRAGAELNARVVVDGIRALTDLRLAGYLRIADVP